MVPGSRFSSWAWGSGADDLWVGVDSEMPAAIAAARERSARSLGERMEIPGADN